MICIKKIFQFYRQQKFCFSDINIKNIDFEPDSSYYDSHDLFEDSPLGHWDSKYFELNDLLINTDHKNFEYKALHLNIRSLATNFDKLNIIIGDFLSKNCDLDFVFLCETFFADLNSSLFNIEGFQKVEKHCSCTRGGGVALYINNKHDFFCQK